MTERTAIARRPCTSARLWGATAPTLDGVDAPVVAVIPTYRPSDDVVDHVEHLAPMVDALVVADDASPCSFDPVLARVASLPRVSIVRHRVNAGIARSLNAGLRAAQDRAAVWLLTIDQDTTLPDAYVASLLAGAQHAQLDGVRVGVIAPEIVDDEGGPVGYPTTKVGNVVMTAEVFQTGALWSVEALTEIGGFDEALGIDAVDAAACLALRRHGCAVVLEPEVHLQHRWGRAEQITVLGRTVAVTHHSPERRTTMVRNRLRLAPREFRESPIQGLRSLRRLAVNTLLAVTVEDRRWEKAKASARGLRPAPKR